HSASTSIRSIRPISAQRARSSWRLSLRSRAPPIAVARPDAKEAAPITFPAASRSAGVTTPWRHRVTRFAPANSGAAAPAHALHRKHPQHACAQHLGAAGLRNRELERVEDAALDAHPEVERTAVRNRARQEHTGASVALERTLVVGELGRREQVPLTPTVR